MEDKLSQFLKRKTSGRLKSKDEIEGAYDFNFRCALTGIEKDFHFIKSNKKLPGPDSADLAERLVTAVSRYLADTSFLAEDKSKIENAGKFVGLIDAVMNDLLLKKYKTHQENREIACFVQALILFGSPRIQAIRAAGEWLGKGFSTIRTCHEIYRKRESGLFSASHAPFEPESTKHIFVNSCWSELDDLLKTMKQKPFPQTYKGKESRAYNAFKCFIEYHTSSPMAEMVVDKKPFALSMERRAIKSHRQKKSA